MKSLTLKLIIFTNLVFSIRDSTSSKVLKRIERCSSEGFTGLLSCATIRALRIVKIAEEMEEIELAPEVFITRDHHKSTRISKSFVNLTLPSDSSEKIEFLTSSLLEATLRFFSGRILKIKFPETYSDLYSSQGEGRGKVKKVLGPFMLSLGSKMMTIIPIVLGGVSFLAVKALIVGKMALVLSSILFIQYLAGRGLMAQMASTKFSLQYTIHMNGILGNGFGFTNGGFAAPIYGASSSQYGTNQLGNWNTPLYARSIENEV